MVQIVTTLDELVGRARTRCAAERRSIIGIAGPPGAGKSTLAQALVDAVRAEAGVDAVALLPMDGYHLPNAELDARGLRVIKGAPETFAVDAYVALLRAVRSRPDEEWAAPGFARDTDEPYPDGHRIAPSVRLVVTEGNYLLGSGAWAPVRECCDETWYVDVDPVAQRERLVRRHHEELGRTWEEAEEFVDRSDLANSRLVEATRDHADLIVRLNPTGFHHQTGCSGPRSGDENG